MKRPKQFSVSLKHETSTAQQLLPLPASICNEYQLRNRHGVSVPRAFTFNLPPIAQYINAYGFVFDWGHIVERRLDNQVLWEFCLDRLLDGFHQKGQLLVHLQQSTLNLLETLFPELIAYDREDTDVHQPWLFYPGGSVSVFAIRCHFTREQEARPWLFDVFIPSLLPEILHQVQCHADQPAH